MATYESTFIIRQDVAATEVGKISDDLAKVIEDNGGKLLKKENWGLRDLAYCIKKNKKGHYIMFVVDAPNRAIDELHRKMKLSEDVIRNLTVRIKNFEGKDSIVLTSLNKDTRHG